MIADVWTLNTTYRLQIKNGSEWDDYSQTEYESADDVHRLASEMYGGLKPDQYRLIEISRKVINNLCVDSDCPTASADHDAH